MAESSPVTGLRKFFFRLPIHLYQAGLGFLVPKRFLFLTHLGRQSGKPRYAVIEAAKHDPASNSYFAASGFGKNAHWYRILQSHPETTIQVGSQKLPVTAEFLTPEQSGEMMAEYAQTYPKTAKQLMNLIGLQSDGTAAAYRRIGTEKVPFVAFRPRA